ncbi:ubiquinol-cytochrome C chaperone family protein [Govanella unica]|uniref:Ubiquinol-cytochrome c chaperone domain-containing protein n=1 Tax=Govanella unica TaxID=2975056 RepID=A0A9X3TYL3_9PROT|nr:hypothetical protein [Govania unica]
MISWFKSFFSRERDRAAHDLYVAAVDQARTPDFYLTGGVADSLDGRFDLIAFHLWLLVTRLHHPAAGEEGLTAKAHNLEEKLLEVHFDDMDQGLREMGVGDLGVGKRIKVMAQAFYGRVGAYDAAYATSEAGGGSDEFRAALARNVYRDAVPSDAALGWLTDYAIAARREMAAQPLEALMQGRVRFPAPGKLEETV